MTQNNAAQKSVLVLGGSGMLGSMVVDYLCRDPALTVHATVRSETRRASCSTHWPGATWHLLDAMGPGLSDELAVIERHDYVVNCIGITKPFVHDNNTAERAIAVEVNVRLPHRIDRRAEHGGTRVLQIATDCVFSGRGGRYTESDAHDALDVYGKTKSLGELPSPRFHHLRCSIIGPEMRSPGSFLLEWFRGQNRGATLKGFVNHRWNGVTTLHFAKLCRGVIVHDLAPQPAQHVLAGDSVSKYELLGIFADAFDRKDLIIEPTEAVTAVDRTLGTDDDEANRSLWQAAGYETPPSVAAMVHELAEYRMLPGGLQ